MTFAERVSLHTKACISGIWIRSFQLDDAVVEIAGLSRR